MARVLIIDDDLGTMECFGTLLRLAPFDLALAASCRDGPLVVGSVAADVMVDRGLGGMSGAEVLQALHPDHATAAVVIVTGFGPASLADVSRLRDGDKRPIEPDMIITGDPVPARAATSHPIADAPFETGTALAHAARRWARAIVPVVYAHTDLTTMQAWSGYTAAAPGTLRNWCRTANVSPRRSLVFARLLRAVLRRESHGDRPEDSLDVVDKRTLEGLLKLCDDPLRTPLQLPRSVEEFLASQRLVLDSRAVDELRHVLRERAREMNVEAQPELLGLATPEGLALHRTLDAMQADPRAQQPLAREIRELMRTIVAFQHGSSGILITDSAGRYVIANDEACAITGYPRAELLERSLIDVVPAMGSRAGWRNFLAAGAYEGIETIECKNGTRVHLHTVAVANVLPGLHVSAIAVSP